MDIIMFALAGIVSGVAASLGIGGGGILIVVLTLVFGFEQINAQGINLLFFIPIALFSVLIYLKNKNIDFKIVGIIALIGIFGALSGFAVSSYLGNDLLKKAFGITLISVSLRELINNKKTHQR